MLGTVAPKTR